MFRGTLSQALAAKLTARAESDEEFALELQVSPRAAFARVRQEVSAEELGTTASLTEELRALGRAHVAAKLAGSLPQFGPANIESSLLQDLSKADTSHTDITFQPQPSNSPSLTIFNGADTVFARSFPANSTSSLGRFEIGATPLFPLEIETSSAVYKPSSFPIHAKFTDHSGDGAKPGLGASFNFPSEAQLYARDPEEFASFFDDLPIDYREIRAHLDDWFFPYFIDPNGQPRIYRGVGPTTLLPNSISLLSPRSFEPPCQQTCKGPLCNICPPATDVNTSTINPILRQYFFGDLTPDGPAALPQSPLTSMPLSSIKAIKVQRAGACTNEQFFADYFGAGGGGATGIDILQTIQDATSTLCPNVDELLVDHVTIVPLMRHRPGADPTSAPPARCAQASGGVT